MTDEHADEIDQDMIDWLEWTRSLKVNDRVRSDLDGVVYTITRAGTRNELEPLANVQLIGSAFIAMADDGREVLLYAWEVGKV